ncbi:bifunctional 5,10-methylenetetrahydrofolate dehydrogenase/5,10-methenyltetrahydrofolate cyclohydrolase [Alloiococcus sp. CFN-8]|uniref:bifunctional 5,10-methylenetetrahydrofolate dehydrogenase/5,10-methenyltetrahydrofolate cyclohydrolase n=1 Tax=Alloiococcus sp. CFN-8 TaxID=3416081 RepID=UPI003CEF1F3E
MGEVLSGKVLANNLKEDIKNYTKFLKEQGKAAPCLLSIQVGEDPGSEYYISNQQKVSESLGIKFIKKSYGEGIKEDDLLKDIDSANKNPEIHGIIIQLPLPKEININKVLSSISPEKDVDGQSDINISRLYKGEEAFVPCTAESILRLIKSVKDNLQGLRAVVIGRSTIVGKPAANLLLQENATVTICHSKTVNLKEICREADVLVSAIGKPKFIDKEYIKPGAIVIDVGTSSHEGKITGDVDFDSAMEVAAFVTPVPGGVGAVTTSILLDNVCKVYRKYAD